MLQKSWRRQTFQCFFNVTDPFWLTGLSTMTITDSSWILLHFRRVILLEQNTTEVNSFLTVFTSFCSAFSCVFLFPLTSSVAQSIGQSTKRVFSLFALSSLHIVSSLGPSKYVCPYGLYSMSCTWGLAQWKHMQHVIHLTHTRFCFQGLMHW